MNGTLDEPKYGALRKVTARVQANDATTGEDLDSDRFDEIVAFSDNFQHTLPYVSSFHTSYSAHTLHEHTHYNVTLKYTAHCRASYKSLIKITGSMATLFIIDNSLNKIIHHETGTSGM